MSALQELKIRKKQLLDDLRSQGTAALKEEFKAFFEAHPNVEGVKWRQYTPYFNDGDPCTFQTNDFMVRCIGADPESGDYENGYDYAWGTQPACGVAVKRAIRELEDIDNEVFLIAFGDHVTVTATREGFNVEEYDHD